MRKLENQLYVQIQLNALSYLYFAEYVHNTHMKPSKRKTLAGFVDGLQSKGRISFTADEAEQALGVKRASLHSAVRKMREDGKLLLVRNGYYVIVPPQHANVGTPPIEWYIDPLMKKENTPYYVGLLTAAAYHGATHQAVMEFQVIAGKQIPEIKVGRSRIGFYYRKHMESITEGIDARKTDAGYIPCSSPELTALDLLRYPHACGGIQHIATVLSDLGRELDPPKLAFLALSFEKHQVQRLGYLLDFLGYDISARHLLRVLETTERFSWTQLTPFPRGTDPDLVPAITERDRRWRITVRTPIEIDE